MALRITTKPTALELLLFPLVITILYWISDALIDTFIFQKGSFWKLCFTPSPHEIVMRMLTLFFIILIYYYHQRLILLCKINRDNNIGSFINQMDTGVIITNKEGIIFYINNAGSSTLDNESKNLEGKFFHEIAPEYQPLLSNTPDGRQRNFIFPPEQKGLKNRIFNSSSFSLENNLMVTMFKDITLQVEGKHRLQHVQQLAQTGEFMAKIGHDIKNTLANILAGLECVSSDASSTSNSIASQDKKIIANVMSETHYLTAIIRGLLQGTRRTKFFPRPLDLSHTLQEFILTYQSYCHSQNIALKYRPLEENQYIIADFEILHSIIGNLISNAAEAIEKNGRIEVGWEILEENKMKKKFPDYTNSIIKLFVKDNGCGIGEDKLSKIFESFYSSKKAGTGLGLAMSLENARLHGWVIDVESKIGECSIFSIYIPQNKAQSCNDRKEIGRDNICTNCHSCILNQKKMVYCCWSQIKEYSPSELGCDQTCESCTYFKEYNLTEYYLLEKGEHYARNSAYH